MSLEIAPVGELRTFDASFGSSTTWFGVWGSGFRVQGSGFRVQEKLQI
jgi:hypothetical protein